MGYFTLIEWAHHTANPWHGCTKVHEGCFNCYACSESKRYGRDIWGDDKFRHVVASFFENLKKFQKEAEKDGVIRNVFCGSMMDIFEKPMPVVKFDGAPFTNLNGIEKDNYTTGDIRTYFFETIVPQCPNLMFLLLTKRSSNINKYIPESWKLNPPANVMYGTSPANQSTFDSLVPHLKKVNGKRFLSIEPLLDKITDIDLTGIDWVIVGGESGRKSRPMQEEWVLHIKDECQRQGVPFFFKQWGGFNKKKNGRLLQGIEYNEMPQFELLK